MKIKFIAILCFLALTIPAHAEHIRNDGMGGFYTDNLHINMLGVLLIKVLRNMKTKIKQELIV